MAEGLNRELKASKPAGKLTFHSLIRLIFNFDKKKREQVAQYTSGVSEPKKIRFRTKQAHEKLTVLCQGFNTLSMDEKEENLIEFIIKLGQVRDSFGEWNPENQFTIHSLLN